MNEDIFLSVVIVGDEAEELTRQCVRSVAAATDNLDSEILLVSLAASDSFTTILQKQYPSMRTVTAEGENGVVAAVNKAIEMCGGEYLLLLHATTVVGEGMLRSLCLFMDEQLNAGALGVRMLDTKGRYLPESRRAFPSPWLLFCQLFGLTKVVTGGHITAGSYLPELNSDSASPTDVVSNGFLLLRKAVLEEVGLLDESFDYRWADIDLLYRINRAGYLNYYYPERVVSYRNERLNRKNYRFSKSFYDAMRQFLRKHHRHSALFVNGGIVLRTAIQSLFTSSSKTKPAKRAKRIKNRRLLILCKEDDFAAIKAVAVKRMADLEHVNLWDLDTERVMDAINRRNQMKGFTDYLFCYPDVRFEQMWLFMDKMRNKNCRYHLYHRDEKRLISPKNE